MDPQDGLRMDLGELTQLKHAGRDLSGVSGESDRQRKQRSQRGVSGVTEQKTIRRHMAAIV